MSTNVPRTFVNLGERSSLWLKCAAKSVRVFCLLFLRFSTRVVETLDRLGVLSTRAFDFSSGVCVSNFHVVAELEFAPYHRYLSHLDT